MAIEGFALACKLCVEVWHLLRHVHEQLEDDVDNSKKTVQMGDACQSSRGSFTITIVTGKCATMLSGISCSIGAAKIKLPLSIEVCVETFLMIRTCS